MLFQEQIREKITIDKKSFDALREVIYERAGISLPDNKAYLLENRLARRLEEYNCKSFEEYFYLLKYQPQGEREIVRMIECMTTNETSFFREPTHYKIFQEEVIPGLVEAKKKSGEKQIRIWSAACSTGEEPYTISILIREMKDLLFGFNVDISASDINEAVIQSARKGIYGDNTLRNVPPHILKKYFSPDGNNMKIQENIKSLVRFANLNLIDKHRLKTAYGMDIIFCKNVLIYFDEAAKKQVVESLYDALRPGGYLFISQAESLHSISRAFKPVYGKNGIVYRKE